MEAQDEVVERLEFTTAMSATNGPQVMHYRITKS